MVDPGYVEHVCQVSNTLEHFFVYWWTKLVVLHFVVPVFHPTKFVFGSRCGFPSYDTSVVQFFHWKRTPHANLSGELRFAIPEQHIWNYVSQPGCLTTSGQCPLQIRPMFQQIMHTRISPNPAEPFWTDVTTAVDPAAASARNCPAKGNVSNPPYCRQTCDLALVNMHASAGNSTYLQFWQM